jgi:hypothetical protein
VFLPLAAPAQQPATRVEGPLVIHYWPGGERLAEHVAAAARALPPLPALPTDLLERTAPIDVFLAPDPARLDSLVGGGVPEWGAAFALPGEKRVVLPGYLSARAAPHQLPRLLRHELAHVALAQYLSPVRPPRWFDEGYARMAAGEWDAEAAWMLRVAFALHRAPPLDSISLDWPAAEQDARIAYLLASSAVGYLLEHGGGNEGLRLFLERWRKGGALEPALRQTYGFTVSQFESHWLREVKSRYGWAMLASASLLFWAPAGLLLALLYARRRREQRERLVRLREQEIPDAPAYWLGEEEPLENEGVVDPEAGG